MVLSCYEFFFSPTEQGSVSQSRFNKLCVTPNSELIYSEIGNFEFPVPEHLVLVGLINLE